MGVDIHLYCSLLMGKTLGVTRKSLWLLGFLSSRLCWSLCVPLGTTGGGISWRHQSGDHMVCFWIPHLLFTLWVAWGKFVNPPLAHQSSEGDTPTPLTSPLRAGYGLNDHSVNHMLSALQVVVTIIQARRWWLGPSFPSLCPQEELKEKSNIFHPYLFNIYLAVSGLSCGT